MKTRRGLVKNNLGTPYWLQNKNKSMCAENFQKEYFYFKAFYSPSVGNISRSIWHRSTSLGIWGKHFFSLRSCLISRQTIQRCPEKSTRGSERVERRCEFHANL